MSWTLSKSAAYGPPCDPFLKWRAQAPAEHVRKGKEPPLVGVDDVEIFDLFVEIALVLGGQGPDARFDQDFEK